MGDLCKMYQPKTIGKKDMQADGDYPVFGANGIIGRYHSYNHEEPQLVVGCRGACGSVHVTEPFSWITGNTMVIQPKTREVERRFLEYFFRGPADLVAATTGAAQPQITQTSLKPIMVPLPPLEEQRRIVARLDQAFAALDRARAHAEANLADAEKLYQATIDQLFADRASWPSEDLNARVRFVDYRGKTPPKHESGIRLITAKNVRMGYIKEEPREYVLESA